MTLLNQEVGDGSRCKSAKMIGSKGGGGGGRKRFSKKMIFMICFLMLGGLLLYGVILPRA